MMKYYYTNSLMNFILFITFLMMSLMIMFIESKFIMWSIMEISSIMFIGILNYSNMNKSPSLIYYTISSITSLMIFYCMFIISNYWLLSYLNKMNNYLNILIQFFMFIKLGIYPFHYWTIYLSPKISWMMIFIFTTINKITPLYLLSNFTKLNTIMIIIIIMNSMMAALISLKEKNLKKIMMMSSMIHSSYIILTIMINFKMFIIYIMLYFINTFMFTKFFIMFKLNNKNSLLMLNMNKMNYLFIMLTLSYSMLPPMTFFLIKWLFFNEMIMLNKNNFFLYLIMFSSIMMSWTYLNLMNPFILKYKMKIKSIMYSNYMNYYNLMIILPFTLNFLILLIMFW